MVKTAETRNLEDPLHNLLDVSSFSLLAFSCYIYDSYRVHVVLCENMGATLPHKVWNHRVHAIKKHILKGIWSTPHPAAYFSLIFPSMLPSFYSYITNIYLCICICPARKLSMTCKKCQKAHLSWSKALNTTGRLVRTTMFSITGIGKQCNVMKMWWHQFYYRVC